VREHDLSGGFRSEQSACDFAVVRSVIATAKKQGWNIIHTLTQPPARVFNVPFEFPKWLTQELWRLTGRRSSR
jgi:hypothetical protein